MVAGVLAVALVAAGALGAVGTPATPTLTPGPGPGGVGNDTETGTAIGETAGARTDAGDADLARTTTVRFGALPPGVSERGAIDTDALATAHAAAVAEREYRLQLTYDERRDGRTIATVRTTVIAESPTVFHVTRTAVGRVVGPTAPLETAFADGRKRYRLANATQPTYAVTGFGDPPRYRRMARFLTGLLEGESTVVDRIERDGQRRVRVRVRRDDGGIVTATIDTGGVIRRLEATLPLEDGRRGQLLVTLRFADVEVDRPLWFVEGDPVSQTTAEPTTTAV